MKARRIGIVGAGAWGTALAQVTRLNKANVIIWGRNPDVVQAINSDHQNSIYLPGIDLDPTIRATDRISDLADCAVLFMVTPTQALRETLRRIALYVGPDVPVVLCCKGIEIASGQFPSQIATELLPGRPLGVLSGPTFADEVAKGLPTAVTMAASYTELAEVLSGLVARPTFRPYPSTDLIGVEIGGALKNVLAIAAGIVSGRGLGENARAALISRGVAEMMRFGAALGARPATLMGLSGIGDLILTCASPRSRNTSLGIELGQGRMLADILAERRSVTEGEATARAVAKLAERDGIDMPICQAIDRILHFGARIDDTIRDLLARPLKSGELSP